MLGASASETTYGGLAEAAGRLAGPHGGLADDRERLADLAGRIARREDPFVEDPHFPKDATEVGPAVVDTPGGDDVLLGVEQPLDDVTNAAGGVVIRGLVGGIGQYEHVWSMAYVRGPEGIIVSLAQRIG